MWDLGAGQAGQRVVPESGKVQGEDQGVAGSQMALVMGRGSGDADGRWAWSIVRRGASRSQLGAGP